MELTNGTILANRAYLDHGTPKGDPGGPSAASEGGLLAAVRPVIAPWDGAAGTTWIGAGRGPFDREYADAHGHEILDTPRGPLRHRRLFIDDETWQRHYGETANAFLWPLVHLVRRPLPELTGYFPTPAVPGDAAWQAYRSVNELFAAAAREEHARVCWVHDYQLALAPAALRRLEYPGKIGFFLHTPFPALDVVGAVVPGRGVTKFREFVAGLLGADLVGLQSEADCERLRDAIQGLGLGEAVDGGVRINGRHVGIGAFPVGIDVDELVTVARTAGLPREAAPLAVPGAPLVAGLERSDFTKGIPERLSAVARAYGAGVRFSYAGIAAPTRQGVAGYDLFERVTESAVRDATSAAEATGNRFLHLRKAIPWPEVVALQRDADVVFTSSLADGMNLVPIQAAAAQSLRPPGERATLITGKDAGVASAYASFAEDGLIAVDPLDGAAMTETLEAAVAGRLPRVSDRLVREVRRRDARHWATQFLDRLESAEC